MGGSRKSRLLTTLSEAVKGCCSFSVWTPAASSSAVLNREAVLEVAYHSDSNHHSYLFKDPDSEGQWVEGMSSPLTVEDLKPAPSTILLHKAEVVLQVYARYVEELFLSHLRKPTTEVVVCTQHGRERAVEETLAGLGKQKGQWSLVFQDVPPGRPGSWLHAKTIPGKYTGLWKDAGTILEVSDLNGLNVPDKVAVSGLYPLSKLLERHGSGTPNLELELLQKLCEAGIRRTILMSNVNDVEIERSSIINRLRAMGVTGVDVTLRTAHTNVGALVPIQVNTVAGEILVFEVDSQRDTIADLKRQIYSRMSNSCFRLTAAAGARIPTNTEWACAYVDVGLTLVKVSFLGRLLSREVKWDKNPGRYAYYNIHGDVQGVTALLSASKRYREDAALLEMAAVSADSDSLRHMVDVHLHSEQRLLVVNGGGHIRSGLQKEHVPDLMKLAWASAARLGLEDHLLAVETLGCGARHGRIIRALEEWREEAAASE